MKYFATSDTHFGHANIIKYCDRPFASVADMNNALIERWNDRVSVGDRVYFLGDFAMGPGANDDFVLRTLEKLNGHKFYVLGNHDAKHKKVYSGLHMVVDSYPHLGTVLEAVHETNIDGELFVMCHFPIETWHQKERGSIHLHGHTHKTYYWDPSVQPENRIALLNGDRNRFDIGVDMYGGPVEITGDLSALKRPKGWA